MADHALLMEILGLGWAEGQGLGPVRSSRLMRELMAHVVTPPDVNPALHPQNAFAGQGERSGVKL